MRIRGRKVARIVCKGAMGFYVGFLYGLRITKFMEHFHIRIRRLWSRLRMRRDTVSKMEATCELTELTL